MRYIIIWYGIITLIALVACSDHGRQNWVQRKINEEKIKFGDLPSPLPKFNLNTSTRLSHSRIISRSPFQLKRSEDMIGGNRPHMYRKKYFLEQYDLNNLKLVGTLKNNTKQWGLVRVPSSTIYKIRVGDYIGTNSGRVIEIKPNMLVIEEHVAHDIGWEKRLVTLTAS